VVLATQCALLKDEEMSRMNKTGIEYLTHTWNPIAMRCSPISEGCRSCWHIAMCKRHSANPKLSPDIRTARAGGPPILLVDKLDEPKRLRKPAVIGVQFMGDLFHEAVSDDDISAVFLRMATFYTHTFMVLTKRPKRMREWIINCGWEKSWPNIWLGVSVENQKRADERIPILLDTPAAVRFVSCEPILSEIDFSAYPPFKTKYRSAVEVGKVLSGEYGIHWVIVGAESGPGARPMNPDWARSILTQCKQAGVSFFMKQMSKKAPIPRGLMIREWPE